MPRYAVCFSKTSATSLRQLASLHSGATINLTRQLVYFVSVGCVSTPADVMFTYVVRRVTDEAPGSYTDHAALDPADALNWRVAGKHLFASDHASFASGPEVFRTPCHHRSVCIFAAADGQELVGAAVPGEGLSLGLADVSTSQFEGTVIYKE